MAGSRKGERRGGAKKGAKYKATFQPKTGKIRAQKTGRPPGSQNLITDEREREMMAIITGKQELMPKELQLQVMRTMYEQAHVYQKMMNDALRDRTLPLDRAIATVDFAEAKMKEYMITAADVAYKVSPYYHARLAALAVTTDRNTTEDLFDLLLREIDTGPRLRAIEHRKDEEKVA